MAKKLGYKIISKWNYFSLESKQISVHSINYDPNNVYGSCNTDNLDLNKYSFIESWRWIPLTNERLKKLNSENKIICQNNNNKITTLGIITESTSFENTIILEILFGTDLEMMIKLVQDFAYQKNYSKIRILTELESLPQIENLENKFPFYLMEKLL